MGNNLTEKGAKAAAIKADKRAAALRENLKRRKNEAARVDGASDQGEENAELENRQ